ncbi:hypothetical protein BG36_02025 [Aquamicrobium defluvii]|uniref:Uncharacterized protein n=1 Tax=Aquamicrobium defluvii TaxID=69279 RepID=A0A011U2I0_9HYPH|nr:hypothetical protein BG36_02025 [Aquamicrobium defluvii]
MALHGRHIPNLLLRPNSHEMLFAARDTGDGLAEVLSSTDRYGTRLKPTPSSSMAKRPLANIIECR